MITRETVSEKLLAYLNEQITLAELVNWAESCFVEGGFMPEAADRPNFPLTWDVCSAGVKRRDTALPCPCGLNQIAFAEHWRQPHRNQQQPCRR